jgi:alcohol dehydrogenase YqhD (iron-dependent ADH family)
MCRANNSGDSLLFSFNRMEKFVLQWPTVLHFGPGVCSELGSTLNQFGRRILLVTGMGSVRRSGAYDEVIAQMAGCDWVEYSGIKSNPLVADVDAAIQLGIDKDVDAIVALGGGSVIDSAKIISLGIRDRLSGWDIMTRKVKPARAVPLIAVLTLAATGTEMNSFAVLQNPETRQKIGYGHPLAFPRHSFLDPGFSLSVPASYTAYGIADLVAHSLEAFFGQGEASLSDRIVVAIIQEAMEFGPRLLANLGDVDLRARIMYAATLALNGITMPGRVSGDWGVHDIGHTLSFLYDTPHGASLSIAYPAWLKLHADRCPERITRLGEMLWETSSPDQTIARLKDFFSSLKCPVSLEEAGIGPEKHQEILDLMIANQVNGMNHKLDAKDYPLLIRYMAGK